MLLAPACLSLLPLFFSFSPFLLFTQVIRGFLWVLEDQKPSCSFLSSLAVCSAWNAGLPYLSMAAPSCYKGLSSDTMCAERPSLTALADMALLLPPSLITPFCFSFFLTSSLLVYLGAICFFLREFSLHEKIVLLYHLTPVSPAHRTLPGTQ